MNYILSVFPIIADVINIIGITILVFGFAKELIKYRYFLGKEVEELHPNE